MEEYKTSSNFHGKPVKLKQTNKQTNQQKQKNKNKRGGGEGVGGGGGDSTKQDQLLMVNP